MAQWLIDGLTATISGVLTVFAVLVLIAFIISQLKHINKLMLSRRRVEGVRRVTPSVTAGSKESTVPIGDDLELVAVITAAVAASMNTTTDQLRVRSIRRVECHRRRA